MALVVGQLLAEVDGVFGQVDLIWSPEETQLFVRQFVNPRVLHCVVAGNVYTFP
jgi:hypothetical protein